MCIINVTSLTMNAMWLNQHLTLNYIVSLNNWSIIALCFWDSQQTCFTIRSCIILTRLCLSCISKTENEWLNEKIKHFLTFTILTDILTFSFIYMLYFHKVLIINCETHSSSWISCEKFWLQSCQKEDTVILYKI